MDPQANIEEQERIITRRLEGTPQPDDEVRLAELRIALRGWLAAGGFQPTWTTAPRAACYFAAHRLIDPRRQREAAAASLTAVLREIAGLAPSTTDDDGPTTGGAHGARVLPFRVKS